MGGDTGKALPQGIAEEVIGPADLPIRFWLAEADQEGRFALRDVVPGTYHLSAMMGDREHIPGRPAKVVVEAGKAPAPVRVEVKRGDREKWWRERKKALRAGKSGREQ